MNTKLSREAATLLIAVAAMLLTLSSCAISTSTSQDTTSSRASVVAQAETSTATLQLPTPDLTENPYIPPTVVIPTEVAGVSQRHSLVNASPEQIAQIALQRATSMNTIRSGTAKVLIVQPITWDEVSALGLGPSHPGCIEKPPLMIAIIKGDFEIHDAIGMSMAPPDVQEYAKYVVYVFDLWAGSVDMFEYSTNGFGLGKILGDPTLPENTPTVAPVITSTPDKDVVAFFPYLHCGDTLPGGAPGSVVHSSDFGAWHYEATTGNPATIQNEEEQPLAVNQIYVQVHANFSSVAGMQSYVDANKQLLNQIANRKGQVEVSIVFKDYVPVEQFRAFATAHGLKTGVSYLRAIDEDPNPQYAPYYTIHIVGHQDAAAPLPQADVDSIYNGIKKYVPQLSLKGVYATHAWVDAKELSALAADPSVYYVDVTATAVHDDLMQAGIAGADQAVVDTPTHLIFVAMFEQPKENK